MACDPKQLVSDAKCIQCGIPDGLKLPVLIYLAATVAGVSKDKNYLASLAAPYQGIPTGHKLPVLIYLACQIANK